VPATGSVELFVDLQVLDLFQVEKNCLMYDRSSEENSHQMHVLFLVRTAFFFLSAFQLTVPDTSFYGGLGNLDGQSTLDTLRNRVGARVSTKVFDLSNYFFAE